MQKLLLILYSVVTVWALISVLFHGSRPSRSLSWILSILFLPFLGPLLYYLFGVNRRKFKFYKLKANLKRRRFYETYSATLQGSSKRKIADAMGEPLAKMLRNSAGSTLYTDNQVNVMHGGKETFQAIFDAIEKAEKFVHVQYYIFEQGDLQDEFYQLFKRKVAEGVEVRLMYDSLGSMSFKGKLKERFRNIGVHTYPMMPLRVGSFMYTLNYRNHRKIVVVDGKVGFVGGMNVSDKYLEASSELGIWQDIHLRIAGPAVESLHHIFIKDYHFASREAPLLQEKYLPKIPKMGTTTMQLIASGPDSEQPSILHQYIGMIQSAKSCIRIANPYFIPGPTLLTVLKIAAMSGVHVKLLIPRKSDSFLAKYSMQSNFEALLGVNVSIYLRDNFSHSKLIIRDTDLASVGTGNFDYRSFEHNFEVNALVYNEQITSQIITEFDKECDAATLLDYSTFNNRSWTQRLKEGFAKFFSPLL